VQTLLLRFTDWFFNCGKVLKTEGNVLIWPPWAFGLVSNYTKQIQRNVCTKKICCRLCLKNL
jgi:hypothetical protein